MNPLFRKDLEWAADELHRINQMLAQGIPNFAVLQNVRGDISRISMVIENVVGAPTHPSPPPASASGRGSGSCGWCNEHISTDVFRHVQECRKGYEEKQAARVRATAESLQRLAHDLEGK